MRSCKGDNGVVNGSIGDSGVEDEKEPGNNDRERNEKARETVLEKDLLEETD